MREIKFRAWDELDRSFVEPEYINPKTWEAFLILNSDDYGEDYYGPLPLEQYTGLKDKNGREIYEGDICNFPETGVDGTIAFHNGRFTWTDGACHWDMVLNSKDGQPRDSVIPEADDLVIIGNIHENPELVK